MFWVAPAGGILTADLTERLQQMARFRNLLVQVYWKVDDEQVYDMICKHLDELRAFKAVIAQLI